MNKVLESYFPKKLLIILVIALSARLLFLFTITDVQNVNNYEYGEICKNIRDGKGYSYFYYENNKIETGNKKDSEPLPSAFMPLGYITFLLPFFVIQDLPTRNAVVLIFQNILSLGVIVLLFNFTKKYFSIKSALIASLIYALLPELIFASNSINIVTLYHLLILFSFILLYKLRENSNTTKFILLGVLISSLIYLRSEILLYFLFIVLLLYPNHKKKYIFISIIIIVTALLPWQIRNYQILGKPFLMSTNGGLNFYRGHNPKEIGFQGDEKLFDELKRFQSDKQYEVKMDSIYWAFAFKTISSQPGKEIQNTFIKLSHIWLINLGETKTNNPIYYLPWFSILLFSLFGLIKTYNLEKHKSIYVFLIFSSITAMVFFALPRHQTMMKIALIPFCAFGIETLFTYIYKKRIKSHYFFNTD